MTLGRRFVDPFTLLALRTAYRASEHRWATRGIVHSDGSVRLVPLYMRDVPRWASDLFNDDWPVFTIEASVDPDDRNAGFYDDPNAEGNEW